MHPLLLILSTFLAAPTDPPVPEGQALVSPFPEYHLIFPWVVMAEGKDGRGNPALLSWRRRTDKGFVELVAGFRCSDGMTRRYSFVWNPSGALGYVERLNAKGEWPDVVPYFDRIGPNRIDILPAGRGLPIPPPSPATNSRSGSPW